MYLTNAVSNIVSILWSAYGCLIPGNIQTLSYEYISNIILHHRILLYYSTTVPTEVRPLEERGDGQIICAFGRGGAGPLRVCFIGPVNGNVI